MPLLQGEDAAEVIFGMMDTLQRCVMDVSEATQLASKSSRRNTFDLLLTNGIQGVKTLRKTFSKKPMSGAPTRTLKTGVLADALLCCAASTACGTMDSPVGRMFWHYPQRLLV
jgi:hypothetical protein